jgi:chorismate-pyruvate lyase
MNGRIVFSHDLAVRKETAGWFKARSHQVPAERRVMCLKEDSMTQILVVGNGSSPGDI